MKKFALIVGGGKGIRLGSEIPKQFLLLNGKPLLFHTIEKFSGTVDEIILVLPESHFQYWNKICEEYNFSDQITLIAGGETRAGSVQNGLAALSGHGIVAIHDAVRPLISRQLIIKLFEEAEKAGSAVPYIPVKESIRQLANNISKSVNREEFIVVQTPQCFDLQRLITNYKKADGLQFSDDAGLMEHFGTVIHLVPGENSNIKITFKEDLVIAEVLSNARKL